MLGKTFTKDAILAVSQEPPERVEGSLAALLRKELLGIQSDRFSPERGQYVFLGDLVRWVAYETLSKKERKARHLAVARWEEQLGEDDAIEMVASHYLRAYEAEPSADDAEEIRRGGQDRAHARRRPGGGSRGERRGPPPIPPGGRARDVRSRSRGDAGAIRGHGAAGAAIRRRAGRVRRSHLAVRGDGGIAPRRARAGQVGRDRLSGGPVSTRRSSGWSLRSRCLSGEQQDRDLAMLAAQLGRMRFFGGRHGPRHARSPTSRSRIGEAEGLPDVISNAMNTRAILVSSEGRYEEGIALLQHALSLAIENDLPDMALRGYNNLAETLTDRDRYEDGLELYERGMALGGAGRERRLEAGAALRGGLPVDDDRALG